MNGSTLAGEGAGHTADRMKITRVILGQMQPNRRLRNVPIFLRALSPEIRAGGNSL